MTQVEIEASTFSGVIFCKGHVTESWTVCNSGTKRWVWITIYSCFERLLRPLLISSSHKHTYTSWAARCDLMLSWMLLVQKKLPSAESDIWRNTAEANLHDHHIPTSCLDEHFLLAKHVSSLEPPANTVVGRGSTKCNYMQMTYCYW